MITEVRLTRSSLRVPLLLTVTFLVYGVQPKVAGVCQHKMAGQALTAWWARMRPYYTKVHQEMWVGVAIMGYFYYKLSYGGKKAAVKDKSSGHH
ncbi:ATP synthase F(0) complex subunit j, mitochondrial isoform X2 [Lissotriton helveticus]